MKNLETFPKAWTLDHSRSSTWAGCSLLDQYQYSRQTVCWLADLCSLLQEWRWDPVAEGFTCVWPPFCSPGYLGSSWKAVGQLTDLHSILKVGWTWTFPQIPRWLVPCSPRRYSLKQNFSTFNCTRTPEESDKNGLSQSPVPRGVWFRRSENLHVLQTSQVILIWLVKCHTLRDAALGYKTWLSYSSRIFKWPPAIREILRFMKGRVLICYGTIELFFVITFEFLEEKISNYAFLECIHGTFGKEWGSVERDEEGMSFVPSASTHIPKLSLACGSQNIGWSVVPIVINATCGILATVWFRLYLH